MQLEFLTPTRALEPYISEFFRCRSAANETGWYEPTPTGQIRFLLSGSGTIGFSSGHSEPLRGAMLIGPACGATARRMEGRFASFGIGLTPLGWASITGRGANELADKATDASTFLSGNVDQLLHMLSGTEDLPTMAACAEPTLTQAFGKKNVPDIHRELIEDVMNWLRSELPLSVNDLFESQPWSSRQATRLINSYFGGSPKFLARKSRALRVAASIVTGASPSALTGEFYDQSHMIKEVRHFTGYTPGEVASGDAPMLKQWLKRCPFQPQSVREILEKAA